MNKNFLYILMTLPYLKAKGGVANFYNYILPYLNESNFKFDLLEIGSAKNKKKLFYRLKDQLRFKIHLKYKPDLVFINPSIEIKSFLRDGLFVWQAKRKNLPVLVFFHGWDHRFAKKVSTKFYWFFKKTFAKADCFIVLASDFKKQLKEWGIKVPIYVLNTAVDDRLLKDFNIREKIERAKKNKVLKVLFLARIEKEKGIFETIDAFNMLVLKKLSVKLSIAGDGPALKEVKEYVNFLHINQYVNFLGYVTGKKKIETFISHDIYCFPTYYGEGMPVSLLEAMAFGLPVVTRPVGGIKDFFENGKHGFLTNSKDPKILAELMEKILKNDHLFKSISLYNHQFVKKNFMASKVAEKLKNIIKSCVN